MWKCDLKNQDKLTRNWFLKEFYNHIGFVSQLDEWWKYDFFKTSVETAVSLMEVGFTKDEIIRQIFDLKSACEHNALSSKMTLIG